MKKTKAWYDGYDAGFRGLICSSNKRTKEYINDFKKGYIEFVQSKNTTSHSK